MDDITNANITDDFITSYSTTGQITKTASKDELFEKLLSLLSNQILLIGKANKQNRSYKTRNLRIALFFWLFIAQCFQHIGLLMVLKYRNKFDAS